MWIDALLNRRGATARRGRAAPKHPRTGVAVLSCMDTRLDLHRIFGLAEGDAHILRNAGGLVSDEVILALAVSQRLMGTREILVVHHLDCGMRGVHDQELADAVERDTGQRPSWRFTTPSDPRQSLAEAVRLLAASPHLTGTKLVHGVLYDEVTDRVIDECERRVPARGGQPGTTSPLS